MAVVVQKYGGSSVTDLDRLRKVADRVARTRRGHDVVVVVSAMATRPTSCWSWRGRSPMIPTDASSTCW